MSAPEKYLDLNHPADQQTRDLARGIITGAVQSANNAVERVKRLATDRGGKTLFMAEMGGEWTRLRQACQSIRTFVETTSDLSVDLTMPGE